MTRSADSLGNAREILLGKRSPTLKVLDKLLGVGILAAGPLGLTTGQPWLLAAWGWIDQKNELITHLDALVAKGRAKLRRSAGRQRHEVLAATHAALVVSSFFRSMREVLGPIYDELRLTEEEIAGLATGVVQPEQFRSAVDWLLRVPVGLPWAGRGFERNLASTIRGYHLSLATNCIAFFGSIDRWNTASGGVDAGQLVDAVVERAAERYRADYLALAADVPEFRIWAEFGEHTAEQDSLARIEALTSTLVGASKAPLTAIRAINRTVLSSPIVDLEEITTGSTAVRVPTVERGYIPQHYRWAVMGHSSLPSQEHWWQQQPLGTDLAGLVAAHVASPAGAERPLVVLGHPGSGKSLFTKVCAARLSANDAFIPVRVPLRDVPEPTASVYRQIEDVLREATHGRVEWRELCEASANCVRVVLIDGLDELMQATGATESKYLRNVMDFQERETAASGPVAVIVTSRTLVADLAAIPEGCLVVRLEEFTDEQIDTWTDRWAERLNEANALDTAHGEVRAVYAETLRGYGELARQPLLLLLLTIVAAERELPVDGTSAALYGMLLDDFVRRELVRPDNQTTGMADGDRRAAELWKLGLVAFGMVNRGRQHLAEHDLEADLRALPGPVATTQVRPRDAARALDPARRIIGRFFFVLAAEADAGAGGRSYEFLHATFADYLVAFHVVELLRDGAAARSVRSTSQVWDDDLLFALLSHTVLAGYGSRIIDFFAEQARGDERIAGVLEHIARTAKDRWSAGRHSGYDPSGIPPQQRLATYSANVISLRVALADDPVPLQRLCPAGVDLRKWWRGLVHLWDAVLTSPSVFDHLWVEDGAEPAAAWRWHAGYVADKVAMAALEEGLAMQLAVGRTLMRGVVSEHTIDQRSPRIARDLASFYLSGEVSPEELALLEAPASIPAELQDLAFAVAARIATG